MVNRMNPPTSDIPPNILALHRLYEQLTGTGVSTILLTAVDQALILLCK